MGKCKTEQGCTHPSWCRLNEKCHRDVTAPTPAQPPEGTPRTNAAMQTEGWATRMDALEDLARTLERETIELRQSVERLEKEVSDSQDSVSRRAKAYNELYEEVERLELDLAKVIRQRNEWEAACQSAKAERDEALQQSREDNAAAFGMSADLTRESQLREAAEQQLEQAHTLIGEQKAELIKAGWELSQERAKHKDVEKDSKRLDALSLGIVVVQPRRGTGELWTTRRASADGFKPESWHNAETLRAAIDSAIAAQEGKHD